MRRTLDHAVGDLIAPLVTHAALLQVEAADIGIADAEGRQRRGAFDASDAEFRFQLDSDVDYGEGSALSLSLRGQLELQRLPDTTPGVARFDLTLSGARFEHAAGAEREFAELAAELARGVVIELAAGKLKELRSDAPVSAFAGNVFRSVAAAFELPEPGDPAAQTWRAETTDPAGRRSPRNTV